MKVWMHWFGGEGYSNELEDSPEVFDTLADAKWEFERRVADPYYPLLREVPADDGGPSAWLFLSDPAGVSDLYPDRVMEFGPRGGIRVFEA